MRFATSDQSMVENVTLIELAAKAAGITGAWNSTFDYIEMRDAGTVIQRWNPLTDNADALRLAAQLNIQINIDRHFSSAQYLDSRGFGLIKFVERNSDFGCQSAAICSAIVRAAAHVGVK